MSSPYSSNLLQQSSHDAPSAPRVGTAGAGGTIPAPTHTRSTTHVVAQPQYMQPQPQYAPVPQPIGHVHGYLPAPAPRTGGSAGTVVSALMLGLIVILVGAIALVGGYYAMRSLAPSAAEAAAETNLAARAGFDQGRSNGLAQGRADGAAAVGNTAQLRASIARQKAYDAAYQKGLRAGSNSYRAPRAYSGYRSNYRAPSYSFPRASETTQAIGAAQAIANATGAPVDVQVFD